MDQAKLEEIYGSLLKKAVDLKAFLPQRFDPNFVWNVGKDKFIVGYPRLTDLFKAMREPFIEHDVSVIDVSTDGDVVTHTLVYSYTDKKSRDTNVDELKLRLKTSATGVFLEGWAEAGTAFLDSFAKDSAAKADQARAAQGANAAAAGQKQ